MRTFTVDEKGCLLDYLFKVLADTKKTRVRQFLKFQTVSVNGAVTTRFDYVLQPGDQVCVRTAKDPAVASAAAPPKFGIEIVFEDPAVLVIHKPSGLLTIATDRVATKTAFYALHEYLIEAQRQRFGKGGAGRSVPGRKKLIFIVHRIDKDASGLLVFAKNEEVKHSLQSGWKNVKKKYFAVVEGIPKEKSGSVTSFLRENKALNVYTANRADDAKLSTTRYRALRSSAHYSLLEIELDTGRKHQIRVHLADLGHPIAGDERYGCKTNPAGRLALHACELAFVHPVSGKRMVFHSPMPDSFDQILKKDRQA